MDCFLLFYEQLEKLSTIPKCRNGISVDVYDAGTTEEYFRQIDQCTSLLVSFYDRYIADTKMHLALHKRINTRHRKNYDDLKLMLMIDVIRAYEELNHPTRLHSPEGIALLLLLVKLFRQDYVVSYIGLKTIPYDIINLDGLVPFISECSDRIDIPVNDSVISTLLQTVHPQADNIYRISLYHLFESVAAVDGAISQSEKEYLMTLLHLDDDDIGNDIKIETKLVLK
ncbi:MAG: hypothetical protein IKH93_05300 [Bacteroidales bacterium]|nr:hypothetical protein [Bacteroidales bacterium]